MKALVLFPNRRILPYILTGHQADLAWDIYIALLDYEPICSFALTRYSCSIDSAERYQEANGAIAARGAYRN